jgi:Zn-dependent protease with chaperone function
LTVAVYLPLLCSFAFACLGPRLATRYLPPFAGAWTLTVGAGLSAVATTWAFVLLAGTLADELLPPGPHDPVNTTVGATALVLLILGGVRLLRTVVSRQSIYRELRRPCASSRSSVVVLADPVPRAFAVPGAGGHVVVSQGMLAALRPAERRVLFAHERAHLRGGHHWHTGVVAAAAALNPLLIPLNKAVTHLCERWADESAAAAVGDRGLVASSLARAALAAAVTPSPKTVLGYHHSGVGARVLALQRLPEQGRPGLAAALLTLVAIAMAADVDATAAFLRFILALLHH